MGGLASYIPAMAMIGLQFHYAALAIFTRAALLQGMSPRVFIVYRQGIATLALAPIAFSSRRRSSFSISSRSFFFMFVTALIGITANQNTYFEGLYLSSSTMASAITNLTPAMTFLIATIVGLEKIDLRSLRSIAKMLGTLLCVGGAITMALLKGQKLLHAEFLSFKHLFVMVGDSWQLGCLLLFASSFCWAFWMIMQVPISSSCPSHLHSSIWMCFLASLQSTIVTLLFENDPEVWNLRSVLDISCCLYAGVGIAVSFFIQTWCISVRGPIFCVMFNPLCTVITAIVSAIFLHENLYAGSLVGALAVIIGLYVMLWGKAKDLEEIKQEAESSIQYDQTSYKINLEEPLLSDKLDTTVESKTQR